MPSRSSFVALTAIAVITLLPARTPEPTAVATLQATFASVGGRDAWTAMRNVQFTFLSVATTLGQDEWPGGPNPTASLDGTELRDYERPGMWTRYHIPNLRPTLTRVFLRDSAAIMFDTLKSGFAGGAPREGYTAVWHQDPIRILHIAASAPDANVRALGRQARVGRDCIGVRVTLPTDTVDIWADAVTHVPVDVERNEDDPVYGRRVTDIVLGNWLAVGGVRIPTSISVRTNGTPTETLVLSQPHVNVNGDSLFASVPKTAGVPPAAVPHIVELAPHIFRTEGGGNGVPYNVLFAQIGDSIIMVDPALSDAYTTVILDSIRARFPQTPARAFIATHHHADHLGGARAAFAAGLSAITSSENAEYVRNVGQPGAKAAARRRVTPVADSLRVGTGPGRMVIYKIPNSHARGLVMAYFPEAKLLAEVDLAAGSPQDRRDLYDYLTSHGIVVDRLARMHGAVMTWDQFVAQVPGATVPH